MYEKKVQLKMKFKKSCKIKKVNVILTRKKVASEEIEI